MVSAAMTRPHVLIVDDDGSIRFALRELMLSVDLDATSFSSMRDLLETDLDERPSFLVLDVRHDIGANQIDLSIDAVDLRPKVLGERVQLQQVIVNLLVNSIQAIAQTDRPYRYIHLSIEPGDGDALTYSIRDSGPGIAGENLGHVFDSFFCDKGRRAGNRSCYLPLDNQRSRRTHLSFKRS
jgi:C4-dicarboxylate-specific signal transduction histidine kinase